MHVRTAQRTHSTFTMDQNVHAPMRVQRALLMEAIERAFVESRFAHPPCSMFVCIHGDGRSYVSRIALHVTNDGFNQFSLECNGSPDRPVFGSPLPETWTRAEYAEWVHSRPDLYTGPIIEQLLHKADRKNVRVVLVD